MTFAERDLLVLVANVVRGLCMNGGAFMPCADELADDLKKALEALVAEDEVRRRAEAGRWP